MSMHFLVMFLCLLQTCMPFANSTNYIINGDFQSPVIPPGVSGVDNCPTNWNCSLFRHCGSSYMSSLYLFGQVADLSNIDGNKGNLSQNIILPFQGQYILEYYVSAYSHSPPTMVQTWWNGVRISSKYPPQGIPTFQSFKLSGNQGPNLLLFVQVGNGYGTLLDNISLIYDNSSKSGQNQSESQSQNQFVYVFAGSIFLSIPITSISSLSNLYLTLSDVWLYNYDPRNYSGIMNAIFVTSSLIQTTKFSFLSTYINFTDIKSFVPMSDYTHFTDTKFIDNQDSSSVLLDSNFPFFLFFAPQAIAICLLQYALYLLLKKSKVGKWLRPSYFVKTSVAQFLFEQNLAYFVFVCFSHIRNSFTFVFFDKFSLAFSVQFLFCLVLFSATFYFLIGKYLKSKSHYFHFKMTKSMSARYYSTIKTMRYFLRGSIFAFSGSNYKLETSLLGCLEIVMVAMTLLVFKRHQAFKKSEFFCRTFLYHCFHFLLNVTFLIEYIGQDPSVTEIAFQLELIIVYLLIALYLSGFLLDLIPQKYVQRSHHRKSPRKLKPDIQRNKPKKQAKAGNNKLIVEKEESQRKMIIWKSKSKAQRNCCEQKFPKFEKTNILQKLKVKELKKNCKQLNFVEYN